MGIQPSSCSRSGDLRYHWVLVRLDAIDETEMRELVIDAWRMVVPKRVGASYGTDIELSERVVD